MEYLHSLLLLLLFKNEVAFLREWHCADLAWSMDQMAPPAQSNLILLMQPDKINNMIFSWSS